MLELNVNSKSPAAITGALKKIKEMISSGSITKSTPIHIVLEPGHYTESIKYNLSNPITIESVPGTKPENCIISSNNCEAFNPGLSNRGVFVIGANATKVNLKNFSMTKRKIPLRGVFGEGRSLEHFSSFRGVIIARFSPHTGQ